MEIDRRCREVDVLKEQLTHELGRLQEQNQELLGQVACLRTERDSLGDKVTRLEVQLSEVRTSFREREASLEQSNKQLQERLDQVTHMADQLTQENSVLKTKMR